MNRVPAIPLLLSLCLSVVAFADDWAKDVAVAAWVNDNRIYEPEIEAKVQPVIQQLEKRQPKPLDKALLAKVRAKGLDLLIDERVALTSEMAREISVSDEDVQARVKQIANDKAFGDPARYTAYLGSKGTSPTYWLAELKSSMVIDELKAKIAAECAPCSPAEAKALYDQQKKRFYSGGRVKVSLIVLDPKDAPKGNPRAFATGVANLVYDAGDEAWNSAVSQFSSGPRAANDGKWDWTKASDLPVGLGSYLRYLELAEIKKIGHGDYFYFLRLDAVEPKTQLTFDQAKDQVQEIVMQRKAALAWKAWLKAQRDKATIKIADDE